MYTCFRFLMYSFSLDRLLSKAPSDEMGSVTHVVEEEDRRVRNCYGYDAFGNTEYAEETVRNRFRYTGQQYDSVTGQYYLRARYYNPVIGRFLQEDTYYGDGLNLYAYCRNNPVRYYDPSGHDTCPKALHDQMKGQGIPDVEIAQNVERIQALIADENLSIEDAYKQVTGLDYKNLDDGLGTYADQRGHHPMAKKAFEGVQGYNPKTAVTISADKLDSFGVKHTTITGQQNSLYTAYAKTGQSLTMDAMKQIEIQAMTNAGVPLDYATNAVNNAIVDLSKSGISQPVKIPWN